MKKTESKGLGQIRIIAGQWRGRKLPVPHLPGLRPTTDRVRETLFNWLAPALAEARCLDCYAGSGALGFEALSRYAAETTFIELDKTAARQLQQNLQRLNPAQATILNTDTLQALSQAGRPFDIVFVDPPFRKGLLDETLQLLENNGWLGQEALIYVESEVENGLPNVPNNWVLHREKVAGQVAYRLFIRQ